MMNGLETDDKRIGNGHERKDSGYLPNVKRINYSEMTIFDVRFLEGHECLFLKMDLGVRVCLHYQAAFFSSD